MRTILTIAALVMVAQLLPAQSMGEKNVCYQGKCFDVFTVILDTVSAKRFKLVQNTSELGHSSFVQSIAGGGKAFAINGGPAKAGCAPLGLRISEGKQYSSLDLGSGNGSFYLKPNGVFLISNNQAHIVESSDYNRFNDVSFAIQSGPMMIINNSFHPAFNANSPNQYIRSGVGISRSGGQTKIVFAVAKQPVKYYEIATFFQQKLNCSDALCLQSVNCAITMPYIPDGGNDNVICSYITFEY